MKLESADVETDSRSVWRPLTRAERLIMSRPVHALAIASHHIGLRNRLRCPNCRAVGTWKPHKPAGPDVPRRWLCKWCGYYIGPRGTVIAYLDMDTMVWALPEPGVERQQTPAEVLKAAMGRAWPWVG